MHVDSKKVAKIICYYTVDNSPCVWLMSSKDGQVYSNNRVLSLSKAFRMTDNSHSLMCVAGSSATGDWYYHNGTVVPNYGRGFAFYTSKGDDGTVVRLHTKNNVSLMNTSQFCCELLNTNDLSQN